MPGIITEFRDFISRGNLVDLAVAVVIGAAFGALVTSLVTNMITPIVAAIIGKPDFSDLTFTINGSVFRYGEFLNALITFLSVAAAVFFFVVKPYNVLMDRIGRGDVLDLRDCPECLSQIPTEAQRCKFCGVQVGTESAGA